MSSTSLVTSAASLGSLRLTARPGTRVAGRPALPCARRSGSRVRAALLGLGLGIALPASLLGASPAAAHARLSRSQPADGAALVAAPATVDLWFNELLDEGLNEIAVLPAAYESDPAKRLAIGSPSVDPADRTHLSASLPALAAGRYVVHWKVLSRDGHAARGRLEFRVESEPATAP